MDQFFGHHPQLILAPTFCLRKLMGILIVELVWCNGRTFDSGPTVSGFETRLRQLVLPLCEEINRHLIARRPSSLSMLIGLRPHNCSPSVSTGWRALIHASVKTSGQLVFELGGENYSPSSTQPYPPSVFFAGSKAKKPRKERPQLRASQRLPHIFIFPNKQQA